MDYLNPAGRGDFARAPHSASGGLDDQVYNRLLRERIIFLGSVVEDSMANAIAAQILLLAAEDPKKDIFLLHQLTWWFCYCRYGDLRHHAICTERRCNSRNGSRCIDGSIPCFAQVLPESVTRFHMRAS